MTTAFAWLATYALHSTILLGIAWGVTRVVDSDVWQDWIWKAALIGGVATASVAVTVPYSPLMGRWGDAELGNPVGVLAVPGPRTDGPAVDERPGAGPPSAPSPSQTDAAAVGSSTADADVGPFADRGADGLPSRAASAVVILWAVGAAAMLLRLVNGHLRFMRQLHPRLRLREGAQTEFLARLWRGRGRWTQPRLTESEACPTPLAMGNAEICLPRRFFTDLEAPEQEAALAHELAHIVRRDPLWQIVTAGIEAVLFFQPLNRVARQSIRTLAERLADDWAVGATGDPMNLARCLTAVSSWVGSAEVPSPTLAIAEGGGSLLDRVERLTRWRPSPAPRPIGGLAIIGMTLGFVAWAAPSAYAASPTRDTAQRISTEPVPLGEAPSHASSMADTLIRHPDPDAPLAERWSWARTRVTPGPVWIAWSVGSTPVPGRPRSSSTPGATADETDAPLAHHLPELAGRADVVAIGFRTRGGDAQAPLEESILRGSSDGVDLSGAALLWLGPARPDQSLALLAELAAGSASAPLRGEVSAAILLHDEPAAVFEYATALLAAESDADARAEAVQWLSRHPFLRSEPVSVLSQLAYTDPSRAVQAEAIDALAVLAERDESSAREALIDIADSHDSLDIRSEALQALTGRKPEARR